MRPFVLCCLLVATACGTDPSRRGAPTPESAVRRFVDAGRSGDTATARACLVRAEQQRGQPLDYRDLGAYQLTGAEPLGDGRAVVTLRCGDVRTPIVAVRESGVWRVSLRQSLQQMQRPSRPPLASAPR